MATKDTFFCVLFSLILAVTGVTAIRYQPNWESIDSRPLPAWYDESKIGIFIHWGVFSVPSLLNEWFWHQWITEKNPKAIKFMHDNYRPDWTYQDFANEFTAEFFNPDEWASVFNASGARYIVLTSKHHEGFTNWPSKYSFSWNSMDVGPRRDLVGSLADSIRKNTNIKFGLYHSLYEWYNPLYLQDKNNNYQTNDFVMYKTMPELYEIVNKYKPEVIWSDGDWEAKDVYWNSTKFLAWLYNDRHHKTLPELYEIVNQYKPEIVWSDGPGGGTDVYWNSTHFLAWLYNDSPVKDTVVTNDRWGSGIACHHGGYFTCSDRYNPGVLQKRKWENAMTIDRKSWGFRRDAQITDILSMEELIGTMVETVSCGGNILINVGPTHDGRIVPIFQERLLSLGKWLNVNGEAIYSTVPWKAQNDTETKNVWYTAKKSVNGGYDVYAIVLQWPNPGQFYLGYPTPMDNTKVHLLGYPNPIQWTKGKKGITLTIPIIPFNQMPCDYAWVFKMENLA